ncbi:MAG: retron St85 family RNA-directed DNA polymerase [Candidatus Thiodiazotropha taylori]
MSYNKWINYYRAIGLRPELIEAYGSYIKTLLDKKLPVIYNFEHLCLILGRNKAYLASAVNSSENHYREFSIPKRSGKTRTINAPYPALLECQKWINSRILSTHIVSDHAHGFVKGRSIITNAETHLGSSYILKMDLKDFFPSISFSRVMRVFLNCGYTPKVSYYLSKLCTLNNKLPQGAASSPTLSNIIAFPMDNRLANYASRSGLRYTRYADDLVFSGNEIRANFIKNVSALINDTGFEVNPTKTQLIKSNQRKIITGIHLTNHGLRLPRKERRKISCELHFIFKYGYYSHILKKRIRDPFYLFRLQGRLAFWRQIEPHNPSLITASDKLKTMIHKLSDD